jgi:acyl-CoA reductase-like NAD-dependent aldehyde dehydrogenase
VGLRPRYACYRPAMSEAPARSGPAVASRYTTESFPWVVNGELVWRPDDAANTAVVRDPATLEPVGRVRLASNQDVDKAVDAAYHAYPDWSRDLDARRRAMLHAADVITRDRRMLAELLTREQGKPIAEAAREVDRLALWLRHYALIDQSPRTIRDTADRRIVVVGRPLGVVAAITPWNYPISLLGWKLAPGLAAGNTIVVRPSLSTPLTTLRVGALLQGILPAGVVNVLASRADAAAHLVAHPAVRKVAFTGSVATGREIMRAAGPDMKRITLELGGNDAAIVLEDADADDIAERIFWGAFTNCGQVCIAIKRLFVPASLHDRLVERLAARAETTRIGHGLDPTTELGPLNNEAQRARVEALIVAAKGAGARVIAGGRRRPGPGWFHEPTIVSNIGPGQPLVDEEQFGPALPVIRYRDEDEAVAAAALGSYGLGASIWTSDLDRGSALANRLDVGTVWLNQHG